MGVKRVVDRSSESLEETLDRVETEEMSELNDIATADDGYVHDEPLLCGYTDPMGTVHSTFTYREMNGKDEEAINKSELRGNGAKIVNTLVERCVSEIGTLTRKDLGTQKWSELVKKLYGGDLDYIALKIREISKGKEIKFVHKCPECNTKLTTTVMTDEVKVIEFKGEHLIRVELPKGYRDKQGGLHKTGVIRLMTGLDRELVYPVIKKNFASGTTMIITRLLSLDDGTIVVSDSVGLMSLRDREYIEKLIDENTFGIDTSFDVTCSNCGNEMTVGAGMGESNFL